MTGTGRVVPAAEAGSSDSDAPLRTQASAPLVTKLEKRLSDFPPRRLCLKFGKGPRHSPVFWGVMMGNGVC